MALLVFLTTTTRTRIITANLWAYFYRLLLYRCSWFKIIIFVSGIILTGSLYLRFVTAQLSHVGLLLCRRSLHLHRFLLLLLLYWNFSVTKEVHNIFIYCTIHLPEQG